MHIGCRVFPDSLSRRRGCFGGWENGKGLARATAVRSPFRRLEGPPPLGLAEPWPSRALPARRARERSKGNDSVVSRCSVLRHGLGPGPFPKVFPAEGGVFSDGKTGKTPVRFVCDLDGLRSPLRSRAPVRWRATTSSWCRVHRARAVIHRLQAVNDQHPCSSRWMRPCVRRRSMASLTDAVRRRNADWMSRRDWGAAA